MTNYCDLYIQMPNGSGVVCFKGCKQTLTFTTVY